MKCLIEGNGIKVFGKAVHALSRIGDEMWLDPLEKGLAVRTVNSSQSAYGCFFFTSLFFQQYIPDLDDQHGCEVAKCKLNMKCVLPLFRCVAWRDRSVDRCEISISVPDNRVIFQFHCRHGIMKTYNLGYQECDALQAVFPTHLCPNVLTAQPKLMGDLMVHFPISQEEITVSISSVKVTLKTYCEEEKSCVKGMNTELSLHPDEFDYFQVGVDSAVTFCLKELRGLLSFAESYGVPVSCHFGVAGQPVSFSVEDMMLEANVVLSTLKDLKDNSPPQVTEDQVAPTHGNDSAVCPVDTPKNAVAGISLCEGPMEAEVADVELLEVCIADVEQIPSSQGSGAFSPALHMREMIQLHTSGETQPRQSLGPGSILTTPITPATFRFRSLLFGDLFNDISNGNTLDLPCLVYASDTEEDGGTEEELG
ncbi:cell cycle checkpoint control protein RAD9B [Myxocyprinus asiaticus]|uniref:cell cycle checkpoint control protein RAD9B n=1 Tax=Myxocyprinus asiaticus TaxID=70543 RepID=UPI0022228491|nr:cell cycle checkpoint control protein RAD9B [Myxocyprinus asiaticus]